MGKILWYPTSVSSYVFPLDLITPQPIVAYSLRKLRSAYSGNCARVRRSSNSGLLNIGFSDNYWNTANVLSHIGSGDGFLETWYDQSANGFNSTQTATTRQPRIAQSGAIHNPRALDNAAALSFSTTGQVWNNNSAFTAFIVVGSQPSAPNANFNNFYFSIGSNSGSNLMLGINNSRELGFFYGSNRPFSSALITPSSNFLIALFKSTGTTTTAYSAYLNKGNLFTVTNSVAITTTFTTFNTLFNRVNAAVNGIPEQEILEFILYKDNVLGTSDHQAIRDNIITYFGY